MFSKPESNGKLNGSWAADGPFDFAAYLFNFIETNNREAIVGQVTPELEQKLQELYAATLALIKPPLTIFEVFNFIQDIGEVVKEASPLATEEEYLDALRRAWAWADEKFLLVEKADEALKFPVYLAPAELFDGTAIRFAIEKIALPQLAKKLAHLG